MCFIAAYEVKLEAANAEGNLMLGSSQHKARLMLQRYPYASGDGIMSQERALDGSLFARYD